MGMSLKQIRYLYAIGVFKRDGSKDRLKKSTPLTGLTKRQASVRLGKIGSSLSTGEVSTTHRLRIGDQSYPIQKDRNGSSYPAVKGKTKSLSELPAGEMSIERIDIKAKKSSKKGAAKIDSTPKKEVAKVDTSQKGVAKVDALPDLTQTTYAKASKAFDDEWAKTVRDDKGFTDPVRQIEGLGKVRDYVHGKYVLNDDYDNLLTKDQLIEKMHPGSKAEHHELKNVVPESYSASSPEELQGQIRLRNSTLVNRTRQDDHAKAYSDELDGLVYREKLAEAESGGKLPSWASFRDSSFQSIGFERARVEYDKLKTQFMQTLRKDGDLAKVVESIPRLQKNFEEGLSGLVPQSRTTQKALAKILEEGFRSQVSTGSTMAANKDTEMRRKVDSELFGFTGSEDERPIYGYLGKPDGSSSTGTTAQYGEVVVTLKPSTRSKTTITWGDSIDNNSASYRNSRDVPTPLSQPQLTSLDPAATVSMYRNPGKSLLELQTGYIEAQIHGGIKPSDIDVVHFRSDSPPKPAIVKKLKLLGISYTVAKSDDPNGYYPKARGK